MESTPTAPDAELRCRVRFGRFELDRDSLTLSRDGWLVRLRPQAATVLRALVDRAGEVVSREELISEIWGDTLVEFEPALNVTVGEVRSALGDRASRPTFIETVRGEGYRFIAETAPAEATAVAEPRTAPAVRSGGPWLLLGVLIAVVVAVGLPLALRPASGPAAEEVGDVRLLVVPFDGEGEGGTQARVLADELVEELSHVPGDGFAVVSSETNHATHLVEGIVHGTADGDWRLSVTLVRTRDARPLWSGTFELADFGSDSPRALIAARIRDRLGKSAAATPVMRRAESPHPERANELYLKARYLYLVGDPADVFPALDLLSKSLADDERSAEAWRLRGDLLVQLAINTDDRSHLELAREAAARALELEPRLGGAHLLLANLALFADWDVTSSSALADAADELGAEPLLVGYTRLWITLARGDMAAAQGWAEWIVEKNPRCEYSIWMAASIYLANGEPDRAYASLHHGVPPGLREPLLRWMRLMVAERTGRTDEAAGLAREILARAEGAEIASRLGHESSRAQLLSFHEWSLERLHRAATNSPVSAVAFAAAHSSAGQPDFALDWLRQAVEARAPGVLLALHLDPSLLPLRSDPRFVEIDAWVQDLLI